MRTPGKWKTVGSRALDPEGHVVWAKRYVEHLRVRNYSPRTVATTEMALGHFITWAEDRSVMKPTEVTKPILERFQRWLFYYRTPSGKPLTFSSQRATLQKVRVWFRWLSRSNVVLSNPAADLDLPRVERRLPKAILSEREVERVLALPDVTTVLGLRDRTMMEVFYSTGIRRHELAQLQLFDIDADRGTVTVRLGKGRKDRVVPIGERALHWIARYLEEARPELVVVPDDGVLFLGVEGDVLSLNRLTILISKYIAAAKLGKSGACHIFRHSMATAMLEHGADIRIIQEILGHVDASTTAIYTRLSITHLKRIHDRTHPGAKLSAKKSVATVATNENEEEFLATLDAEATEEEDG